MRNGDFSEVTHRNLRSADRRRQRHRPRGVCQQHHSAESHQPDRAAAARASFPSRTSPAPARAEQLPEGADAREDDRRLRRQGQPHAEPERIRCRIASASCGRWCSIQGCTASTAVRPTAASPATEPTRAPARRSRGRASSARRPCIDIRGGLNYYHNVTTDRGPRADDQHRRRHSGREPRRLHERHLARSTSAATPARCSGSRPASPGIARRRPGTSRGADPADDEAHPQVRRRVAAQHRHAAADAGRRRAARRVHVQRDGHRPAERVCDVSGLANPLAAFLLDWPNSVHARPEGVRRARHQALGDRLFVQDKWQVRLEHHHRPRPALGVLHAARRASPARAACPTTIRRPTRSRWPATAIVNNALNVEEELQALLAANRRVVASRRAVGRACRLRREHDSVPGQPLRVQLPGQAELHGHRGERVPGAGSMAAGFPAPALLDHPAERHHPDRRDRAAERDARRHPAGAARGDAALVERRLPAPAAVTASRPTSPTSATAASIS